MQNPNSEAAALAASPARAGAAGRVSPRVAGIAAAVVGVALSAGAFWISRSIDDARIRGIFEVRADWRASDIAHKVDYYAGSLATVAVFIISRAQIDQAISPDQFERVARNARRESGVGARSIAWVPRVPRERLDEFLRAARQAVGPDYRLLDGAGTFAPAADRAEYFPILYVAVFEGQPAVPGFTFDSDPARRAAILRARDEGRPIASEVAGLRSDGSGAPAYFVFWPVYALGPKGEKPATVEARRAALAGFVVGGFRAEVVLSEAFKDTPASIATLRLIAGGAGAGGRPFAVYSPATRQIATGGGAPPVPGAVRIVRAIEALGQTWRLDFEYGPETVSDLRSSAPWGWLVAGLLLTAAIAAMLVGQLVRRQAVEALVASRTGELSRANAALQGEVARRTRDEAVIRETTELLQAVIGESPFAIVVLDPNYNVLVWNRAAERIFGYAAAEVMGKPYPLVPDEARAEFEAIMARTKAGERPRGVAVKRRRKGGALADVVFSGAPLYGADGALSAMVFVLEDVTERRAVESQLRQAQRMEAVGQLTGGIAHDFNNILGVVVGNLDLALERGGADPETARLIDAGLKGALKGSDLVRRLLAFSRRQTLAPAPIDLGARLPEFAAMLRRTLGEHIAVNVAPAPDLWPAIADASEVENALLNLAINARDAMPNGGTLTIETANVGLDATYAAENREVAAGDYVMIAVSDTGSGMAPDVIERAFEPFFTTKEAGKGTGLGLAMVYGFAKQSKGHVKIYSEVGQGTTVKLYLPRAGAAEAAARAADAEAPPPRGTETVLVVEDNLALGEVAERVLTGLGYRVLVAENGPAALARLDAEASVDLLFTDIVMPGGMSGLDLADEVVRRRPGIRVLFATGYAEAAMKNGPATRRAEPMIGKPYRTADLARAVRRALGGNGGTAT